MKWIFLVIEIWVSIYTLSYARWTWKNKNKIGAIMIFLLSLFIVIEPIYKDFIN